LLAYYIWPYESSSTVRDIFYFCVGIFLTSMSTRFFNIDDGYGDMVDDWEIGLPKNFGWIRKLKSFVRKTLSFVGYLFIWVGAWDYIDVQLIEEDITRDSLYVVLPIFISFIFEELLSLESLYYMGAYIAKHFPVGDCCYKCKVCHNFCTPGHELAPDLDQFARNYIQPKLEGFISPCQDWVISVFNYFNVIVLVMIIQLFLWVGMWDLFSYYVWPYDNTSYRDGTYCVIGLITMFLSLVFFSMEKSYEEMESTWHDGLPKSFGFRRKVKDYAREMLNFLGFLFVWVGAWDFIDTKIWDGSVLRDILYFIIPWFISLVLEEFLSTESVYYSTMVYKKWKHEKKVIED